jgi:hypothetical protein
VYFVEKDMSQSTVIRDKRDSYSLYSILPFQGTMV